MRGVIGKSFEELASMVMQDVPFNDDSFLRSTYYSGALCVLRIITTLRDGEYSESEARVVLKQLVDECEAYYFMILHGGHNRE